MRSMTAFGRGCRSIDVDDGDVGEFVWEIRTVNHRHLELGLRLPEALQHLDVTLRNRIGQALHRGKVDARLHWLRADAGADRLQVNEHRLQAIGEALAIVRQRIPDVAVDAMQILAWPGVLDRARPDPASSRLDTLAQAALDDALTALIAQREREGAELANEIERRAVAVLAQVAVVRRRRPLVLTALREKQLARLAELPVPHDEARLAQELVHAAQRLDVDEELARLDTHVAEMRTAMAEGGPIGRRLDFLLQEFNREANTLAAKAADSETTAAAITLKVLIEQMREREGGGGCRTSNSVRDSSSRRPDWPPPPEPYEPRRKNPIESILFALPVIMLVAGVYLFYRGEGAESAGAPLLEHSVSLSGVFAGLSVVQSGGEGRHYLWFDSQERRRGPRVTALQASALSVLDTGDPIDVRMAPHVEGSTTLWAWRVDHQGEVLFDDSRQEQ